MTRTNRSRIHCIDLDLDKPGFAAKLNHSGRLVWLTITDDENDLLTVWLPSGQSERGSKIADLFNEIANPVPSPAPEPWDEPDGDVVSSR